mmetsp:Transcript_7902/g.29154  ORF Transcript_7902/g.29154 Transcript_7902/m.29154 type:complete len:284 (+) Transcript_7902:974-1825(+)
MRRRFGAASASWSFVERATGVARRLECSRAEGDSSRLQGVIHSKCVRSTGGIIALKLVVSVVCVLLLLDSTFHVFSVLAAAVVATLLYVQRELVFLITSQVRIAHKVQRQIMLPDGFRRAKFEFNLLLLTERYALDGVQRARLDIADDEPPRFFLASRVVGREYRSEIAFYVAFETDNYFHRIASAYVVRINDVERDLDARVSIRRFGDVFELRVAQLKQVSSGVIIHINQVVHALDTSIEATLANFFGDVRELHHGWIFVPHRLHHHLRQLHGGERRTEPTI